jgi:hypothetical protein
MMEIEAEVELLVSILIGVGLAAAAGFRIFVPLLVLSAASRGGLLELNPAFDWIGSNPALIALSAATLIEIAVYLIPGLDHLLDLVATPGAIVAGTVLSASVVVDMPPFMVWSLAAIGGGAAGVVQASSVVARGASGVTTLGLANPLVSLGELAGSIVMSALAVLAPVAAGALLLLLAVLAVRGFSRQRARRASG